ncbi:hypothetical protein J3A83DRAFT_3312219 [Scleroderma citrinum]
MLDPQWAPVTYTVTPLISPRFTDMAQIDPMINMALTAIPSTLMLYDYAITLDREVEYIWKRSMSTVSLIYLVLRYFGTAFVWFYAGVFLVDGNTSNETVETWLMHIILQIRLYALYDRSKKVLFIMVLGFIIEVATTLVTMIRMSILEVSYTFNQTVAFSGFLPTAAINIYVNYSVMFLYECLLFLLHYGLAFSALDIPLKQVRLQPETSEPFL